MPDKLELHVYFHADEATERFQTAVLNRLEALSHKGDSIMTAISDFTDKMNAFFTRQDAAMADLQADVDNLNAQILALQNSAGTITPADQALLDGIVARAQTVSDKLDALDSLTPPVAPPPTP